MTLYPTPPTEGPAPMATPAAQRTVELPAGATQQVGEYRLLSILGTGGMGVVYKAFDLKLGRFVALKMLQVGINPHPEELIRFRGEAETLGSLQHPNIVQIYDFGMHDDRPYLVMEYITGGGLDAKLAGQPQPPRRAAELIETLARAIQVAHDQNIIHRDLKPANVLLAPDGTPKITDFGLAKRLESGPGLTQTGEVMGTPSYMAPEQALGRKDVGKAADIYALGAILYECLTGRPPFRGATLPETLEQVCENDPAPPSRLVPRLPRDISTICLKCLHKAPGRRYASAQALADDLRNWLDGHPIQARPTTPIERLWRVVTRRPWQAALVGLGGLLLATLVVLAGVLREQRRADALRAEREEREAALEQQRRDHQQALEDQQRHFEGEYTRSLEALDRILDLTFKGKLKSLPNLEPLHTQLQGYYEELVKRQSSTRYAKPEQLAQAMNQLGTVLRTRGQFVRAREVLDQADTLCERALKSDPALVPGKVRRARVLLERARVLHELGDYKATERDFKDGLALIRELSAAERERLETRRAEGDLLHWCAVHHAEGGDPKRWPEALALYKEALALRLKLAGLKGATKEDRRDLAQTYGYRGDLELDMGHNSQADSSYWASHRIREQLEKEDPEDEESRFQLARSWANLGWYQMRARALTTARHFYGLSRDIRVKLVEKSPSMVEYQGDLASVLNYLAELSLLTRDQGAGPAGEEGPAAWLEQSERRYRDLIKRDPLAVGPRSGLGACLALRARLHLHEGKGDEASAALREAGDLLRRAMQMRPSGSDSYHLAAVLAMEAEREASPPRQRELEGDALKELKKAFTAGFRRLHLEDVANDRAFKGLAGTEPFKGLLRTRAEELAK